ncbi:MAG: hypothetical protein LBD23_06410 [Oscillospiraceae bacterium]|jgi:hypothetical protein|nr:hypothetical protein [Oscillospiraceae bacterium]
MDSNEARQILIQIDFDRDSEILSNVNEYYFRKSHPVCTFSIPINGVLSRAKEQKLLEIVSKIIDYK